MVDINREAHPGATATAVLGDMLELGANAYDAHVGIGRRCADLGFSKVIAVGEFASAIVEGAAEGVPECVVVTRDEVARHLAPGAGDVVLVKGSRAVGLEQVAAALEEAQ